MKDSYIQAVVALIADGQSVETVLANLQTVLETRGHHRLYAAILAGVVTILEQRTEQDSVAVVVAHEADATSQAVQEILTALCATEAPRLLTIDPTLIGGAKAVYQNRHIDQTYKTALRHLYERVTT